MSSMFCITSTIILSYALSASSYLLVEEDLPLQSRIMGGLEAGDGQFPYQVSLQLTSECSQHAHTCGAALVGPRHLVTAASCVTDKPGDSTWTAGRAAQFRAHVAAINLEDDSSTTNVQMITVHPQYDPDTHLHDLAVIQMMEDMSEFGIPLALATAADTGATCNVTGWGISAATGGSYSSSLRWAVMNTKSGSQCAEAAFHVTDEMLCAGDTAGDLCAGDRGAPLVCGGVLRGVATHGGCGGGSIFTDILTADHRSFVQDIIKSGATRAATTLTLTFTAFIVTMCHRAYSSMLNI